MKLGFPNLLCPRRKTSGINVVHGVLLSGWDRFMKISHLTTHNGNHYFEEHKTKFFDRTDRTGSDVCYKSLPSNITANQ